MKTWESRFLGWIGVWVQVAGALWWLFVAAWAVMIYGILTFLLPGAVPPGVNFYVIQPLLWLSLAFLAGILLAAKLGGHLVERFGQPAGDSRRRL